VTALFGEKYPGSKLTLLVTTEQKAVKLKALQAAGTPPDLADVHHGGGVRDMGPGGQVMDLTPLLRRDPYPKSYAGWEPYAWQKKQYGVPWSLQSTAIFYNKALFDQAGVPYPTDRWTWNDYLEAAKKLVKPGADDATTIWGAGDQGGRNFQWMSAFLASFGGAAIKADYSESTLTSPAAVEALEFRASMGARHRVTPNQAAGTSGMFSMGTYAMVTSGTFYVANIKENPSSRLNTSGVAWDVAPVPRGKARRAGLNHELGIGIPTGVRTPDASWAALRFLTGAEGLRPFIAIGRVIPPDRSIWKDVVPADNKPAAFKQVFLDLWDELNTEPPFVPRWPDVELAWQEELDKVWTGERPARDGAAAFKTRMDQHLKELKSSGLL
jgi:multiple sugar transport system substrate-binding protein